MSDSWPAAYSIECMEHVMVDARRGAPAESPPARRRRPLTHKKVEVPGARPHRPRRGTVFKFLIIAIGIALLTHFGARLEFGVRRAPRPAGAPARRGAAHRARPCARRLLRGPCARPLWPARLASARGVGSSRGPGAAIRRPCRRRGAPRPPAPAPPGCTALSAPLTRVTRHRNCPRESAIADSLSRSVWLLPARGGAARSGLRRSAPRALRATHTRGGRGAPPARRRARARD